MVNYECGFLPLVHVDMVPEASQKKLELLQVRSQRLSRDDA